MKSKKLTGGEMVTVTATLTVDQWALLFSLIHQAAPMLPTPCWDVTDLIEKTLNEEFGHALAIRREADA